MDEEIQQRLKADDQSALALIWDSYAHDLLGYLVGILRSRSDAEDALQDVFVRIAVKRREVAAASNLKAYLYGMARNVAVNRMRRDANRRQRHEHAETWLTPTDVNADPDRSAVVQAALAELPVSQRSVIVMKYYRDKTFREIAELLGISENTAGSRYRYGMDKLRAKLRGMVQ